MTLLPCARGQWSFGPQKSVDAEGMEDQYVTIHSSAGSEMDRGDRLSIKVLFE